jgi:predicted NAD-dependent protein-ADP-ribosyltransferase YbiA (DUF1768 family)
MSRLPSYWDDNASIVELMTRRRMSKKKRSPDTGKKSRSGSRQKSRSLPDADRKQSLQDEAAAPAGKSRSPSPEAEDRKQSLQDTTFVFFSKSRDAKPGKGIHEHIDDSAIKQYQPLIKERNWRQVLSNFHVCPFRFEGKTYRTIEHVFQCKKIAIADPVEAERFTVESGDPIGQGDGKAAQKERKLVKLTPSQLKLWESMQRDVMEQAAEQKFAQCPEAMRILTLTKGAKLLHLAAKRGKKSELDHFSHLERIRDSALFHGQRTI